MIIRLSVHGTRLITKRWRIDPVVSVPEIRGPLRACQCRLWFARRAVIDSSRQFSVSYGLILCLNHRTKLHRIGCYAPIHPLTMIQFVAKLISRS